MATKTTLDVRIGSAEFPVGSLTYVADGARSYASFAYKEAWIKSPHRFNISPDLELLASQHQVHKAPTKDDSTFHFAFADTEPDAWGRRVIARAHAKARQQDPKLTPLTELDYLCAVDDYSRMGALRLRDLKGNYLRTTPAGTRTTPPLIELERIMAACRAVEHSQESSEDLKYLLGNGTSLGGMRPKSTVLDADGTLALGKFPSVEDSRSVTRGEVLALKLARIAGIDAAKSRIEMIADKPVAIVSRFDRTTTNARIPYLSGASMLQASRGDEHAYTEIVDIMNSVCLDAKADAQQLWRRLVFNHLINNTDDHLLNLGFLHVGNDKWALSPAFDLNPFPEKLRESKTWLSEDTGPIDSIGQLLGKAAYFYLDRSHALTILAEVHAAVKDWRQVALSQEVGLSQRELADFAPAFEHTEMEAAAGLIR
ncbi:type II toxin-antitoxin system HipA family toxin [Rhodocyclaceae bacterium]